MDERDAGGLVALARKDGGLSSGRSSLAVARASANSRSGSGRASGWTSPATSGRCAASEARGAPSRPALGERRDQHRRANGLRFGSPQLLVTQLITGGAKSVDSAVVTVIIVKVIDLIVGMRVREHKAVARMPRNTTRSPTSWTEGGQPTYLTVIGAVCRPRPRLGRPAAQVTRGTAGLETAAQAPKGHRTATFRPRRRAGRVDILTAEDTYGGGRTWHCTRRNQAYTPCRARSLSRRAADPTSPLTG